MTNWLCKLLGIGCRNISQKAKPVQKILSEVESGVITKTQIKPVVKQAANSNTPSLGSQLSYGKWYYGVDTKAQPTVRRFGNIIEKRYPCKDGGEVVVSYVSKADKSSGLSITKIGNPQDIHKGDWYRGFYSKIDVKHRKDLYGIDVKKVIKKKGAYMQELSLRNGRTTEEVHVPLKRWERLNNGKRNDSHINPYNPNDFNRFCD